MLLLTYIVIGFILGTIFADLELEANNEERDHTVLINLIFWPAFLLILCWDVWRSERKQGASGTSENIS